MVRWGLGICAVGFTVMLLIPVPLRQGAQSRAIATATATESPSTSQSLAPVAAPRAGAALMNLPDSGPAEVPAPAMPEVASIATTSVPDLPTASMPEPQGDVTGLVPALAIRSTVRAPEIYHVSTPKAELHAGPSSLERTTARLVEGDKVEVLSRFADRWLFVRLADGKTEGYLDATQMSPAD